MNRNRVFKSSVLCLFFFAFIFLTHTTAFSQTAGQEPPLTNADVIKLAKLGLGDDVVIAKINQAPAVNFILDTGSIEKMKKAKLSNNVIGAMLKRNSAPAQGQPANLESGNIAPAIAPTTVPATSPTNAPAKNGIWLLTDKGKLELTSLGIGERKTKWAAVTILNFYDYPGENAVLRTNTKKLSFLLSSTSNPSGRIFVVKLKSNKENAKRSLKVGGFTGWMSGTTAMPPDSGQVIAYTPKQTPDGYWELTLNNELKPGEYGVWRMGEDMYDFGVD